ncbi:MAG: hypothetical protein NTW60_02145 [Candidatus Wolfebacteria bacterium]|nr:hypothetical protein [Candidatus Wolfebacteria bacterium]
MNIAIFKAYDIRGKYPEEINEATVARITETIAKSIKKGKIIIGCDVRASSFSLCKAALDALKSFNGEVVPVGVVTTPMFYFLVNQFKANRGIMVTASHNPKEYNGLKMVKEGAFPISGKEVLELITGNQ